MLKKLIVMGILIISLLTMGCTLQDPRSNPSYSVFPEILLDYDSDTDEVKIWVKSALSDFKYDNIKIEISDDKDKLISDDNNTYCLNVFTKSTLFNLSVQVKADDKEFGFDSQIEVDLLGEYLIRITIYEKGEKSEELIRKDDLPYKKVLKEI